MFLNRSYWPDAEATGQLLTELCEDLSDRFAVTVICGQPNENPTGAEYRRFGTEVRNRVTIRRVWHTRFPKSFLPGRAVNYVTFLLSTFWASIWLQRPDLVVVETDPPLLAFVGRVLQRWRGVKLVVYLQDIHPDIGVALGKIRDGFLTKWIRRGLFRIYRGADCVLTLSRDMRDHVIASGVAANKVAVIPNWIDSDLVYPVKKPNRFREKYGLNGQFVVMYSGNLGLCQRLEDVIAAADCLRVNNEIQFLLVGGGSLKSQLEADVAALGLPNVRFVPYQPKSELADSLSAADVHLIPLDPRVTKFLMPSKLYGILASGTPAIVIAERESELASVVVENGTGLAVTPNHPRQLAETIQSLAEKRNSLETMGTQARHLAEERYHRTHVTDLFGRVLLSISATA